MTLEPKILRHSPQLAAVEMLRQTTETTLVALCAAHPAIERVLRHDPQPSLDRLADHVVDRAMLLLDALDRYCLLLGDIDRLRRGLTTDEDTEEEEPVF